MYTLKHGLYLTYKQHASGKLLAVASDGSPQHGHTDITVLDVELVSSPRAARQWFRVLQAARPWEAANWNVRPNLRN